MNTSEGEAGMKRREKKKQEQRSLAERSRVGASRQKKEALIPRSCLITLAGTKSLGQEGTSDGQTARQADFEEANRKG